MGEYSDKRGVVQRPDHPALALEQLQQAFVIDVEAQCPRRRVEVRAVDEEREFFFFVDFELNRHSLYPSEICAFSMPFSGGWT